ncbi:MAG: hypothetical protein M3O55_08570 [Actinomycetota bacterium]|nr:hypothetical protein [Actinomycetota bacterium]
MPCYPTWWTRPTPEDLAAANPSGLNAHYHLDALTEEFARLRAAAG